LHAKHAHLVPFSLPLPFSLPSYITGSTDTSLWTNYKKGVRQYCGHALPEGLKKNQQLGADRRREEGREGGRERGREGEREGKEGRNRT